MGTSRGFSLVQCLALNVSTKQMFSGYLEAIVGTLCPHEEMKSVSTGGRTCVSSERNPIHAHQTQSQNQTKSCMGTASGGFTSKCAQGSEANG